jgi:hypothetical protein
MHEAKRKFLQEGEVDRALRARWRKGANGATNKHRATERTIHLPKSHTIAQQKLTTATAAVIEGVR